MNIKLGTLGPDPDEASGDDPMKDVDGSLDSLSPEDVKAEPRPTERFAATSAWDEAEAAERAIPDGYDGVSGARAADVIAAQAHASAQVRRERTEDDGLNAAISSFIQADPNGWFDVHREGPSGMPACEIGYLGRLKVSQIRSKPVEEALFGPWGGGEFLLVARRSDGALAQAPQIRKEVAGDPKPKSSVGKAWLREASVDGRETRDTTERPQVDVQGTHSMTLMLKWMDSQADRAAEERRDREAREEKERERQREEHAIRMKELDARLERERSESAARVAAEADIAKRRLDAELEMMRNRAASELEMLKARNERALESQKASLDIEKQVAEMKLSGGLGFDTMKSLKKQMAEVFIEQAKNEAGLNADGDGEEGGIMGTLGAAVKENFPALLQIGARLLLGEGGAGELPPPIPQAQPQPIPPRLGPSAPPPRPLPAPAAPVAPVPPTTPTAAPAAPVSAPEEPDGDSFEPEEAAPADAAPAAPAAPPAPDVSTELAATTDQATQVQAVQLIGFLRATAVVLRAGPRPDAAWVMPLTADGSNLADMFGFLHPYPAAQFAAGWDHFAGMYRTSFPKEIAVFDSLFLQESNRTWFAKFIEAGPWNEESD